MLKSVLKYEREENMVTEKGTIKIRTVYDEEFFRRTTRFTVITFGILLAVSVIGLIIEIVSISLEKDAVDIALLCGEVLIIAGSVIMLCVLRSGAKKVIKLKKVLEFELFSDAVCVTEYQNGEKCGAVLMFYGDFIKKLENKYYFQFYRNSAEMFALSKEGLSLAEADTVKSLLQLPLKRGEVRQTLPLPAYGGNPVTCDTNTSDVFGELTEREGEQ